MLRMRDRNNSLRRGAVIAYLGLCLPVMLAVIAVSVDAGLLLDRRRHVQAAADAAALAAAGVLFETYTNSNYLDNGTDPLGHALQAARRSSAANGYPHNGKTTNITVFLPPETGLFKGRKGHVEVIVEHRQNRAFSSIFGSGELIVRSRAVARGKWAPSSIGILVLDPTGTHALTVSGEAAGMVPNAAVIVNSTDPAAAYGEGNSGGSLIAEVFQITGGVVQQGGNQFIGEINLGVPPTPDPFRDLPQPDPTGMPVLNKEDFVVNFGNGYKTYYLKPGVYTGGLSFDGKSSVVMEPGIYYMNGGGFTFKGNESTSLTAEGVMVFNAPGSSPGPISISGQATVKWSPPTEGIYQGMSFFQDRSMTETLYIAGNGLMNISGAFYAAGALIDIAGNGDNYVGTQFVSYRLTMRGSGVYNAPWDAPKLPSIRDLRLVE